MATLTSLVERKAKADALPEDVRAKYGATYADVCEQIQARLIDIAFACNDYTQVFIADPDDFNALIPAAQTLIKTMEDLADGK